MANEFPDVDAFLTRIFDYLAQQKINISNYGLDHVCYRVETQEEWGQKKKEFSEAGVLLGENIINGRPIAVYRLDKPLQFRGREIYVVELPAPKEGQPYTTGWEHVEFVIHEDFDTFRKRYPHVNFKDSSKPNNPLLVVSFDGLSIKFHHTALEMLVYEGK